MIVSNWMFAGKVWNGDPNGFVCFWKSSANWIWLGRVWKPEPKGLVCLPKKGLVCLLIALANWMFAGKGWTGDPNGFVSLRISGCTSLRKTGFCSNGGEGRLLMRDLNVKVFGLPAENRSPPGKVWTGEPKGFVCFWMSSANIIWLGRVWNPEPMGFGCLSLPPINGLFCSGILFANWTVLGRVWAGEVAWVGYTG